MWGSVRQGLHVFHKELWWGSPSDSPTENGTVGSRIATTLRRRKFFSSICTPNRHKRVARFAAHHSA